MIESEQHAQPWSYEIVSAVRSEVRAFLWRHARSSARDPRQDTEDLVHEVLLALFDHDARELRRWTPERGRSLTSFARLLARRRLSRIFSRARGNPWGHCFDPSDVEVSDGGMQAQRVEARADVDALVQRASPWMQRRDRELFRLLFVQEREHKDVAGLLGMSDGAVTAWAYRTRKRLRSASAAR